ncbi:hypothetical protein LP420_22285 [Massilia sp. B-10]|nr:hypothetical protein LP420_22285 [Massilia sp. B-10]
MSQIDFFNEQAALDSRLESVFDFLIAKPELAKTIGNGLRRAFDEVIDGERTGRFCLEELEKTEKTYIGTKVEIVVRNELNLKRGEILDNLICGQEVDTKFSLSGGWMIPREAVGHICLLIKGSDNRGRFSVGLLRTSLDVLTKGANQDFKRTISAVGKQRIKWLILEAPMVPNFLLELDPCNAGHNLRAKEWTAKDSSTIHECYWPANSSKCNFASRTTKGFAKTSTGSESNPCRVRFPSSLRNIRRGQGAIFEAWFCRLSR